ncbi:poly(ethylene terephthalate) hydrolase family protein [Corynebacterium sphenisci]|uniref:poly(ethylene terephthalate) hydrolase family protein n=1 Tax=Corynebacterium sphenisci TaxID=191493 RepID=UPI0026DFC07E|nr:alpha/beta hydrolase [Corynebacterium sphenisci]MDO5730288.1 alpha/beta hydrolase [Corynebacterium sphenisci]
MPRITPRRTGALAALAATSLLLTPVAGAAPALPEGLAPGSAGSLLERPGPVDRGPAPANSIRGNFSAPGPRPVAASAEAEDCDTLVMRVYTKIAEQSQGLNKVPGCYGYAPAGLNPAGVEYVYPADLAEGETAPLVIASPGIGAEPGILDPLYRHLASHGYIVAVGFNLVNWMGTQVNAAAIAATLANADESGPLHGHVDFSRTALVGHSAGGGAVMFQAGIIEELLAPVQPDLDIRSVVALNPGPAEFGVATRPSDAPTLVVVADNETMAPVPLARARYDKLTAPAWWAGTKRTWHATALDWPENNPYAGLTLSFIDFSVRGDAAARAWYAGPGYGLAGDPELFDVERNAAAEAL